MGSSREAAVAAEEDPHPRPAGADPADDARDLLDRAGRGVDVGAPELGRQQVAAAEDVERQVAVAVVVAVEEPPLLVAVQRVVGGVEVEHDLLRRPVVGVEEEVDEQRLDRRAVVADPAVAVGLPRAPCSSRFSVLLPASGAQRPCRASSRPSTTPSTGSWRSWSWSIRSS